MSEESKPTTVGTIAYDANAAVVWLPVDKSNPKRKVDCRKTLQFIFEGPGTVQEAVMIFAPLAPTTAPSPFDQTTPVILVKSALSNKERDIFTTPETGDAHGTWEYSISFMAQTPLATDPTVTTSSFYFLPDPELAVGSGPAM